VNRGLILVVYIIGLLLRIPFLTSLFSGSLVEPLAIGMWLLGVVVTWTIFIFVLKKSRKKTS